MKVVCVNNEQNPNLTKGKLYYAGHGWNDPNSPTYYLIDDKGNGNCIRKDKFILLEEYREERLGDLLDEV